MHVEKIKPQGYCKGVIYALKKVIDTVNNPDRNNKIYLLGMIIHNKLVCEELKQKGILILEGLNKLELVDSISDATVIISAHGVSSNVKEKIKQKGLKLVDATCPDVLKVHENVINYLNLGYEIIYIGKENHPETVGVLGESKDVHLVKELSDLDKLDSTKSYYVTNQTTLAHSFLALFHEKIKEQFPNVIIENNICMATTLREEALYGLNTELIVVVGDYSSSNTKKLVETAKIKAHSKQIIAIERASELLNYDLSMYSTALVTSGASTPKEITEQVVRFLQSDCKDLTILDEELIFF